MHYLGEVEYVGIGAGLGIWGWAGLFMTVSFFPGFLLLILYLYLTTWLINCEMKSTNE